MTLSKTRLEAYASTIVKDIALTHGVIPSGELEEYLKDIVKDALKKPVIDVFNTLQTAKQICLEQEKVRVIGCSVSDLKK